MASVAYDFGKILEPPSQQKKRPDDYQKVLQRLSEISIKTTAVPEWEAHRQALRREWLRAVRHHHFYGDVIPLNIATDSPSALLSELGHRKRLQLEATLDVLNEDRNRLQQTTVQLEQKILLLEHQLSCDTPYLQMFRFGAGSLFFSVISLLMWLVTGVGAPFHPIFAGIVIPVAVGLMVMAFLVKPRKVQHA